MLACESTHISFRSFLIFVALVIQALCNYTSAVYSKNYFFVYCFNDGVSVASITYH
jgi:hypothetical protein